jgi:hypothetical protein
MLDTFHWFHGEGFDLIVEDLIELAAEQPVIAEVSGFSPISSSHCLPSATTPCGSCLHRSSGVTSSTAGMARPGLSLPRRATRTVLGATCSNATVCSPIASKNGRDDST